jgi:ABC-type phosphate/phosphonate transport system permease subunit
MYLHTAHHENRYRGELFRVRLCFGCVLVAVLGHALFITIEQAAVIHLLAHISRIKVSHYAAQYCTRGFYFNAHVRVWSPFLRTIPSNAQLGKTMNQL